LASADPVATPGAHGQHASKYRNGANVAAEFRKQMAVQGVVVNVHHIREAKPTELSPADLYVFSSPGRMGKPIGGMRRFLKTVEAFVTRIPTSPDAQRSVAPTAAAAVS
jgi:hypothetical protein